MPKIAQSIVATNDVVFKVFSLLGQFGEFSVSSRWKTLKAHGILMLQSAGCPDLQSWS